MARETKTVRCYPDADIINGRVERYEAFGWELINNQRCRESDGETQGHTNYSTFNELTFSRDKSATWYGDVVELENEYNDKENEIERLDRLKPNAPYEGTTAWKFTLSCLAVASIVCGCACLLSYIIFGSYSSVATLIIGIITLALGIMRFCIKIIIRNSKRKKYREALSVWEKENKDKISAIQREQAVLAEKASKKVTA